MQVVLARGLVLVRLSYHLGLARAIVACMANTNHLYMDYMLVSYAVYQYHWLGFMNWLRIFATIFLLVAPTMTMADDVAGADEFDETADHMTSPVSWTPVDKGLDMGVSTIPSADGFSGTLRILRINPQYYTLRIYSASQEGQSHTLREWVRRHGLVAAINAGMYAQDGVTGIGYLRTGKIINNGRAVSSMGVFFAAGPLLPDLPEVLFLERPSREERKQLEAYETVVQNYRLLSHDRRIQWTKEGSAHAIAAVGQDGEGRVLFIYLAEPVTCIYFSKVLLSLNADIRSVMYVEGGREAGLLLNSGKGIALWGDRNAAGFLPAGGLELPLPNIIGVKRR